MYFNVNCVVLDAARVTIGSNVLFGPGVQLYAATRPLDAVVRRIPELAQPITIGDDCWLGGGAIICPGVAIGEGCVIGAGAVMIRDVPAYSLAVGNPARVVKQTAALGQAPGLRRHIGEALLGERDVKHVTYLH